MSTSNGATEASLLRALELVREWTQMDGRIVLVPAEVREFKDQLADAIRGIEQ